MRDLAPVLFASCEPLLGPVDLRLTHPRGPQSAEQRWGVTETIVHGRHQLDWCIIGGESGPGARPCVIGHVKDLVRQCRYAGVATFVKQLGSNPVNREGEPCPHIRDRKGADPGEWPEELRIREFPAVG